MGALSRMATVVRAEVNEVLNRIEDPKKMVRQMIWDMQAEVDDALAAVAHAIANERLLDRRLAQKREDAALWTRKAEAAFDAGEEELARKALVQKVATDEAISALEKARAEAEVATQTLKDRAADLKAKLATARTQQGVLTLRMRASRARRDVAMVDVQARSRYDEFVADVTRDEVAAEVYAEMAASDDGQLKEEFDRLEQKQRVEAEIQALKEKAKQKNRPSEQEA